MNAETFPPAPTHPVRSLERPAGLVVWFTGLSSSGKTTLATAVELELAQGGHRTYRLDGDVLRAGLCRDLDFSPAGRHEQARRAGFMSAHLADAGLICLTALISPYRADRQRVRELLPRKFLEIFVNAPLAVCEQRDTKGLYQRARANQLAEFTGITSVYEPPISPDLEVRTDCLTVQAATAKIVAAIEQKLSDRVRHKAAAISPPSEIAVNLTDQIVSFLREIGIQIRTQALGDNTVLPGIEVERHGLIYDPAQLKYPGDLLHEAGHLAVKTPTDRQACGADVGNDPAEEMMAISWSYAAARHLGLPPEVVFHPEGYRGGSQSLLDNFAAGRYLALPMLQWIGLTHDEKQARQLGVEPFPKMKCWLRPA